MRNLIWVTKFVKFQFRFYPNFSYISKLIHLSPQVSFNIEIYTENLLTFFYSEATLKFIVFVCLSIMLHSIMFFLLHKFTLSLFILSFYATLHSFYLSLTLFLSISLSFSFYLTIVEFLKPYVCYTV